MDSIVAGNSRTLQLKGILSSGVASGNYVFLARPVAGNVTNNDTVNTSLGNLYSNAGPDQFICGNSATLAANNPAFGTGQWMDISGSSLFSNPNAFNSGVTSLAVGLNRLKWTVSQGPCAAIDTVEINVTTPAAALAGPDQNLCDSTGTLAGNRFQKLIDNYDHFQ